MGQMVAPAPRILGMQPVHIVVGGATTEFRTSTKPWSGGSLLSELVVHVQVC